MPLPKIDSPIFELTLPSTGEQIKYRPFLVKEQKILLFALEGGEQKDMISAIKQIISNCAITPVDVEKLPTFDLEYFFVRLRAKSISETVDLIMRHANGTNSKDEECDGEVRVKFNLLDLEVVKNENHMDNIVLDEVKKIGVKLKYPTMNMSNLDLDENKTQMDIATESIIHSIDYIYDEDNIYKKEDTSKAELVEFIDNLSQEQFTKLATFFETMPKLKHKIKWKCNKCRMEEETEMEGMANFFDF